MGLSSDCSISRLPLEILSKIFTFLGHSDQKVCRSVCLFWMQVVETCGFYRESLVHLKELDPEKSKNSIKTFIGTKFENFKLSCMMISPCYSAWEDVGERLRSLQLVECELTERELSQILLSTKSICNLGIINCRDVFMSGTFLSNAAEQQQIGLNLVNLKSLHLDDNKYLSDVLLLRITEITPNINLLSVAGCNLMNDAGIYLKHYPASQEIHASPSVLTWRILVRVVQNLALTIRSLDVSKNTGVDLDALADLSEVDLRYINLSACGSVTHTGLLNILVHNKNLRRLNLTLCRRVFTGLRQSTADIFKEMLVEHLNLSRLSMPHFSEIASLKGLQTLEIDGLDAPGREIIQGLTNLNSSKLKDLQARFLGVPCQDLAALFTKKDFSSLRRLDLSTGGEDTVNDQLLQAICSNMQQLTHLNLSNNPRISDIGVFGLASDGPSSDSVLEMRQMMQQKNIIPLGSKEEKKILMTNLRREVVTESLLEEGKLDAGLFLLTRLQDLDLSLTSVSSLTLKMGINAPDLRRLSIDNCPTAVEGSALHDFAVRHSHLERLELGATPITDTGLISCLSCLPRLIHLDISACQDVTSAGLRAVCQVAPQIESLLISNCAKISLEAARTLEAALPNIKQIQTLGLQNEQRGFSSYYQSIAAPPPAPPPPR